MRQKVIWSPLEIEYLKKNRNISINQLTITLAKSVNAIKNKMRELDGKVVPNQRPNKRSSKIGKRKDCDNQFFRSSWESNLYRLLKTDPNIKLIEYEPHTFTYWQFGHKSGTVSYVPDFKIHYQDGTYNWIEVKGGFLKPEDKTKLRRFKKYYPDEFKLLVAVSAGPTTKTSIFFKEIGTEIRWFYPELNKKYRKIIPNWE